MLMAGSNTRLFIQIVLVMLMLAFWIWIGTSVAGLNVIMLWLVLLSLAHTLVLAVQLIDLPTPVLSAGPNGLVLSNKITGHDLIPWESVKSLGVHSLHYPAYLPLFSYLVIRTGKAAHFTGLSRLLPTSWFGVYIIPTRLLRGGSSAAEQLAGTVKNVREAERHAQVGGERDFMSDTSLGWNMVRNTEFPVGKDGPGKEVQIAAVRDSLMEQAGVHRDLLPEPVRQQILASESGAALAAKGEEWGRQAVNEPAAKKPPSQPVAPYPPKPQPNTFGRKGVMLNGKPLD
jgi:hypothetical protein